MLAIYDLCLDPQYEVKHITQKEISDAVKLLGSGKAQLNRVNVYN